MQAKQYVGTGLIALVAGFAGAALFAFSGLGSGGEGQGTREYLMANPEVLREASGELQRRDMLARLGDMRGELETPFPGAVMGNPNGSVTLVEFSDYACGFCRQSLPRRGQLAHPRVQACEEVKHRGGHLSPPREPTRQGAGRSR